MREPEDIATGKRLPVTHLRRDMEWLKPDWSAKATPAEAEAVQEWSGETFYAGQTAAAPPHAGGLLEKNGKLWPIAAKIRENPGTALLIALGAGFLAGTLWKRI